MSWRRDQDGNVGDPDGDPTNNNPAKDDPTKENQ